MKFTTHDTNTLMILVINNSKMFCDKSYVCKEVKEYFNSNPEDFSMCNYLFNWEMLKTNTNFIIVKVFDGIEYLGLKSNNIESTQSTESAKQIEFVKSDPDQNIDFTIDVSEAIMCAVINKRGNNKCIFVKNFLLNNLPGYSSVYELLQANKDKIGYHAIKIFIDYYSDIFDADEIIKLIIEKKICEWEQNKKTSQELIKKHSHTFNFSYGLVGVVGIATLLTYKNPWLFRYFNWWHK